MRASVSRTIGRGDHLEGGLRLTRRLCAVSSLVPPTAEDAVVGDARRDDPQDVEALLDRVRVQCHCFPGVLTDAAAYRVVGRPQRAGGPVHDDQVANPLGVVGRQHQTGHAGPSRPDDRGLLASGGVHHREGVLGPECGSDRVAEPGARRRAHAALVEPDDAAERRKATVESVERRLRIDRIEGDERAWQHQQVNRAIAENLVGDVQVAALGVASPRSLRHSKRLAVGNRCHATIDNVARNSAAAYARSAVEGVRDDPAARLALMRRLYEVPQSVDRGYLPYRRAASAFMGWQLRRGLLNPQSDPRPGSPWWRALNEGLLRDTAEARALAFGHPGEPSGTAVSAHLDFIRRPTARNWYRAHNASIVEGYLANEELASAELRVERFFINVVLVRVLFAHALVAAPRLALGWLAPLARPVGDPRVGMTGIFLSLSRVLPDRYPLGDDVEFYVAVEHGFGHTLGHRHHHAENGPAIRLVCGSACAACTSGLGRRRHSHLRMGSRGRRSVGVRAVVACQGGPPAASRTELVAFARQRESPVGGLLDQPVDEQRVQGAVALRGVGQPRHVELGAGDGRVVAAQHIQQAPADLAVGARIALDSARRCRALPGSRATATRTRSAGRCRSAAPAPCTPSRPVPSAPPKSAAPQRHSATSAATSVEVTRRRRRGGVGPAVHGPGHHAAHVRVDDGHPLPVRETRDGARGVCADSGQRQQRLDVRGHHVVVLGRRSRPRTRAAAWPVAGSRACPRHAAHRPRWRRRSPTVSASAPPSPARSAPPGPPASAAA